MTESAEDSFRNAFHRLVSGTPLHLPPGAPVTQNNVAREAGRTSSALRKERFPRLVEDIQTYLTNRNADTVRSVEKRQAAGRKRDALRERYEELLLRQAYETSRLLSVLAELTELRRYVTELEKRLSAHTVATLAPKLREA